jgi:hypothetical protein
MTSSAIVSLGIGLLLAGCSNGTQPRGPSNSEVTQSQGPSNSEVTEQLITDTKGCRGMLVEGQQTFPISIISAKPVARSVEGNAATVIVEAQYRATEGGWESSPARPCEDFKQNGTGMALTRIKMKYKKYDTGWMFERYEHKGDIFQ